MLHDQLWPLDSATNAHWDIHRPGVPVLLSRYVHDVLTPSLARTDEVAAFIRLLSKGKR
jgi:hypothetical protein